MKPFLFFSAFFLSIFSKYSFAQVDLGKSIDSLIQITSPRAFNGVILIAKNGDPIYQKSHGYSDLTKRTALTTDDQFLIGSISKQFTAVLVLREIQGRAYTSPSKYSSLFTGF